ncbi:hypothetical protein BSPWISOXPB_3651 [uncultured Gammaproteobacteria bacterium]|nr:hypothetical protein BSPWISOXPB_3651 [uncultured Gammaproteobacteria bacterium]
MVSISYFLRKEIDVLFEKQAELGNQFTTDELKQKYKQIVFTQRPIQFKADLVGKCTFEQDKYRGAKNCFSAEKSVLLNKINNTDLIDENTGEIKRLLSFQHLINCLIFFKKQKKLSMPL